jgi:hemoglobin
MQNSGNWACRGAAALVFVAALAVPLWAQDESGAKSQKTFEKQVRALLPRVINTGADLFNEGDRAGCYRLYQGSLLTLRPLLEQHPDLQKAIDAALADADQQRSVGGRAFALRSALDKIRDQFKTADGARSPSEKPSGKPLIKEGGTGTRPPEKGAGKPAGSPADKAAQKLSPTLWDRLGGEQNVRKVVDDLVALAAKDTRVNFDRKGKYKLDDVKVADLKAQIVDFISSASGGPLAYTGKSMKEVHKGMGITTAEFEALAADLKKALEQNGAKPPDVQAVLKAVEGTRKDIVEVR